MGSAEMTGAVIDGEDDVVQECYHCGLPVPARSQYYVKIGASRRRMCCVGCEAVAQSIVDNGLSDYYRHRDAMPESPRETLPSELQELGLFDHPDFQKTFVQPVGEHEREASLILEGITCAACVWLNEQHVARQAGVLAVEVNYATRRARVRWDERQTKLSAILGAIKAIGYRGYPYDVERSEQIAHKERRAMLWRVFVAGFGMMQVMMYAIPAYLAGEGEMSADIELIMRWASLLLTLPVILYSAAPFFQRALRDVRLRRLGMDVPVALGVGSAFIASVWSTLTHGPEVYFDSVTMFVFFLLCGRYLEMGARQKAVRGVEELGKILPVFAERVSSGSGESESEKVPVSQLEPGDRVRVRPGEIIPADAVVIDGVSEANEALLTGESRPVVKRAGSPVTGGSINITSPLLIEVCQVGDSTRLAAIRKLMERAAAERPLIARQADNIARLFVTVLLTLAAITFVMWQFIDPARALWVFVSVLVVACPCALSLATPAVLTVATDTLARIGLLVTRGHAIETLARANRFVFDKTGTLTYGVMRVDEVQACDGFDETQVRTIAAALEQASEHALAAGIRAAAAGLSLPRTSDLVSVTGQGVEGNMMDDRLRLGRPAFVAQLTGLPVPGAVSQLECRGGTVVALGSASAWIGALHLTDVVREDAGVLFDRLAAESLPVSIISGDAQAAVAAVAEKFAIDDAHAGMTPQDKQAWVARCQQMPGTVVAMIGDGVNDAPVLAQAQVSIAMGGGTDLARNQADIVLLSEKLATLSQGIAVARRALRIIHQNLSWAFAYNLIALPLAMAGLVTPWMAGIGMAASSLLVVLNALRLQKPPKQER